MLPFVDLIQSSQLHLPVVVVVSKVSCLLAGGRGFHSRHAFSLSVIQVKRIVPFSRLLTAMNDIGKVLFQIDIEIKRKENRHTDIDR